MVPQRIGLEGTAPSVAGKRRRASLQDLQDSRPRSFQHPEGASDLQPGVERSGTPGDSPQKMKKPLTRGGGNPCHARSAFFSVTPLRGLGRFCGVGFPEFRWRFTPGFSSGAPFRALWSRQGAGVGGKAGHLLKWAAPFRICKIQDLIPFTLCVVDRAAGILHSHYAG
jgi:hypothetical protein